MNKIKRDEALCIEFFFGKKKPSYKKWLDIIIEIFYDSHLDLKKVFLGVDGDGYSDKLLNFKRNYNKLDKEKWSKIEGIMYVETPSDSDAPAYDWFIEISLIEKLDYYWLNICFDISFMEKQDEILKKLQGVIDESEFQYGYIETVPFKYGPPSYASGVPYGHLGKEIEKELFKWFNVILDGESDKIRGVYEINFLSHTVSSHIKDCQGVKIKPYTSLLNRVEIEFNSIETVYDIFIRKGFIT